MQNLSVIDKDLAEGVNLVGQYTPTPIFAGDLDVLTDNEYVAAGQTLAKYTVVARNSNRQLVALNPAASDGTQIPVGVLTQAVTTGASVSATRAPFYKQAYLNFAALVWPAAITTVDQAKAAFENAPSGTNITIGSVRL